MPDNTSRRSFLRNLIFAQPPAVPDPGTRTLVCIFLRGGADTLNLLVPYGDDDYYATARRFRSRRRPLRRGRMPPFGSTTSTRFIRR